MENQILSAVLCYLGVVKTYLQSIDGWLNTHSEG